MPHALRLTTILVAFMALSMTAFAQGRHDEKPHGTKKSAPAAAEQSRGSGTGGRHDEGGTTHGKKKPQAKNGQGSAEEQKGK